MNDSIYKILSEVPAAFRYDCSGFYKALTATGLSPSSASLASFPRPLLARIGSS